MWVKAGAKDSFGGEINLKAGATDFLCDATNPTKQSFFEN